MYLSTKNGFIQGEEQAPFILPYRWTFETLQACIGDYVNNRLGLKGWTVSQIYYKKSGKSRKVVAINSDYDISSLLAEYPMITSGSGRRSREAMMIMAVDLIAPTRSTVQFSPLTPKHKNDLNCKYNNNLSSSFEVHVVLKRPTQFSKELC